MNAEIAIEAQALTRTFAGAEGACVQALPRRSFVARRGESVALVGRSGCGKSTLLNILGLLEPPSTGRLSMLGVDVLGLDQSGKARFRRRHIGVVFQNFCLLKDRSVRANVELPLVYAGVAPAQRRCRVDAWLDKVELGALAERCPPELSGGQQQRAALARAMVAEPCIVLADEPTGSLDAATGRRVTDYLLDFCAASGACCIIATHDEALAAHCCRIEAMDRHDER